jgi:hypothetical protein
MAFWLNDELVLAPTTLRYAFLSAAFTCSSVKGVRRRLNPVASNASLPIRGRHQAERHLRGARRRALPAPPAELDLIRASQGTIRWKSTHPDNGAYRDSPSG